MAKSSEWQLRQDLCEAGRRLYRIGFMSGSDGNLSTLLNENEVLITPSRLCKGYLEPHQIVKVDRQGHKLAGDLPVSLELAMHLAAYEERPDICAVAHCHPPILIAFTVAGLTLPASIMPEIEVMFAGEVPVAAYATPGGPELANSIRNPIRRKDVILLDHHGTLSAGQNIFQAAMKTEHAEASARVIYYARQLSPEGEQPLPHRSLDSLRALRARLLATENQVFLGDCHISCHPQNIPSDPSLAGKKNQTFTETELEVIVQEVVSQLLSKRG